MIRPGKLDFRVWKATLGKWGSVNALLKRFDKNASDILARKTNGLINKLVEQIPNFNAVTFVSKTLPIGGESLSAKQYDETLELAGRLADAQINPSHAVLTAIPALAQNCTSGNSFSTNLVYLEALTTHARDQGLDPGKPLMVAVKVAAKELDSRQLTTSMVLATRLGEMGVDPTDILRFGIPAVASALNSQQFRLAMTLSTHAARRGCDVAAVLQQLPDIGREISPEQLTAGLRVSVHLEEKGVGLHNFFRTGLPAIVHISGSGEHFARNLDLFSALVLRLHEKGIVIEPPLTSMTHGCEQPDDFRLNVETLYRFALQMQDHGVPPALLLKHGFPPSVSQTPATFQATLNNLATVVVRLRGAGIDENLLLYIVEYGLDRVSKTSTTTEHFRQLLLKLMKSFRQLALKDIEPSCHQKALRSIRRSPDGFLAVTDEMSPQRLLSSGLSLIYELAANPHFDWRKLDPGKIAPMAENADQLLEAGTRFSVDYDKQSGPQLVEQTEGHAAFRSRARAQSLPPNETSKEAS